MIPDPWRKRKKCSPSRRSFQVEQPQAAPKGFSRITSHETRLLCLPTHDFPRFPTISRHFPAFPGPPTPPRSRVRAPFASATRPVGFSRVTKHETWFFPVPPATPKRAIPSRAQRVFTNHESRNTNHGIYRPSVPRGCARVAQPETPARTAAHVARSLLPCALWRGMGRLWRGMGAIFSPSRCPRAVRCEIPVMCTKSRFPQENARSAAFAAAPFALGAQPAEVDPNGHTAPASAAKSPLIRVDSCPFVVNEPVLRKGNVLYCIDRLFDKRAPAGSRGFRGECRAGWSGRASSSERKSHAPR